MKLQLIATLSNNNEGVSETEKSRQEKRKEVEGEKKKKLKENSKAKEKIQYDCKQQSLPPKQNATYAREQRPSRSDKTIGTTLFEVFEILCKLPLRVLAATFPIVLIGFNINEVAQSDFSFFGRKNKHQPTVRKMTRLVILRVQIHPISCFDNL